MAILVESLRLLVLADREAVVDELRAVLAEIPWLDAAQTTIDHRAVGRAADLHPGGNCPDAILVELPREPADHGELVGLVKRRLPAIPVVVLTGSADDTFEAELLLGGASDCLATGSIGATALGRALARALAARRDAGRVLVSRDPLPPAGRQVGRETRDEAGARQGFRMLVEDVAERRQLEQQLRHAQKMEAVGRLAGGIAHDFNNVLTAMLGQLEMLGERFAPGDPRRAEVGEIRRVAERASTLTRQLLAFSRRRNAQPEQIDVNAEIARIQQMLRRLIGEDVELDVRLGAAAGGTLMDPGQLEQVVMNLVVNGRDAMPDGGRLTIETESLEVKAPEAARHGVAAGPFVRVSVGDTGSGMPPEVMARLFEPFFTTKDPGKGTGLGLTIVHGIVRQGGGFVTVDSEIGRGTVFRVYLPGLDATPAA